MKKIKTVRYIAERQTVSYDIIATQERKNTNDNKRGSFGIRSVVS